MVNEQIQDSTTTEYGSDLTYTGLNKFARAGVEGKKVYINTIAFGDNNGSDIYTPNKYAQSLVNEKWRGPIERYEVIKESPTLIKCTGKIPSNIGGFFIREFGFFDDEGDLIAVGNTPTVHKVYDESGSALFYKFTLYIQFESNVTGQLVIQVNPDALDELIHDTVYEMSLSDMERLFGFKINVSDQTPTQPPSGNTGGTSGDCNCDCGDLTFTTNETVDNWFDD